MSYLENLNLRSKRWWSLDQEDHIRILLFSIYQGSPDSSFWKGLSDGRISAFVVGDIKDEEKTDPKLRLRFHDATFSSESIPDTLRHWAETLLGECVQMGIVDVQRDAFFRAHLKRRAWYFELPLIDEWEWQVVN